MKSTITISFAIAALLSKSSAVTPEECTNAAVEEAKLAKEETDDLL